MLLCLLGHPASAGDGDGRVRIDGGWATPNLLRNASLEEAAGPTEPGRPAGWTFDGEGKGASDREVAAEGSRSLRIDGIGSWTSDPFPLTPEMVTILRGRTRLEGSGRWGVLFRLDFLDADGRRVGKIDPYLRDAHGWTAQRAIDVAPPDAVQGRVACYTLDDGLHAWCDDLEVRQWTADPDPLPAGSDTVPGLWRYDFGTPTSEVQPGYAPIDPGSRYRRGVGHGWTASGRLRGRDQVHGDYRPQELNERGQPEDPHRTLLDPLTRDSVFGVGAARFRVDVPPGRYRGLIVAGQSTRDEPTPYFDLQVTVGPRRVARLSKRFPRAGFVLAEFSAEAGDRGLEIAFSSDRFGGAWSLTALVLFAEDQATAGEAEVERVRRSIDRLPEDLLRTMQRIPSVLDPAPPVPPAPGPTILAGGWPEPGPPVEQLGSRASPGLSADYRFALQAGDPLDDLWITVDPWQGDGGELDAEQNLWFARDRALPHGQGYVDYRLYRVQPDELTTALPTHLDAGQMASFWLRVRLAPDARPGSYRSRLRVSAGDADEAVDLQLQVLPFSAESPRLFQNVYFSGERGNLRRDPTIGVEEAAASLRSEDVADIVDHLGVAVATLQRLPVYRRGAGGVDVELAFLREQLGDHRRAGFPPQDALVLLQPMITNLARLLAPQEAGKLGKHVSAPPKLDAPYWEAFAGLVESVDRELAAQGVERRLYNLWDEAFGDDLEVFIQGAAAIRTRLPDARIFCNVTTNNYYGTSGTPRERGLRPWCDAWWVYGTLTDEERRRETEDGTWLLGDIEPEGPVPARAASGVLRWRRGEIGGNWWVYDFFAGSANTQLDGPSYGDRCLVYPTDPPSPRLAWEATRVGHEDLRYLTTLERWLEGSDSDARRAVRRAVREGRAWRDRLHAAVDPTVPDPIGSYAEYDRFRGELLDLLLAIHHARER